MWNDNNAMLEKRGRELAKQLEDPLAISQRKGKENKPKAVALVLLSVIIAALIAFVGFSGGNPSSLLSNNVQNTPTPSSEPSPSYQQPTINKDYAVNAQSDQLPVVNTTNIDDAFAQHTDECSIDALGHYAGLSPQCQVQQRLVISVVQNEIETIPTLFEIDEQLILHRNNVDETVQFFLNRNKYPKSQNFLIKIGRFITGDLIGGGGLGGGRPGGGGGGDGGGRSTLPFSFSPPPLNSKLLAQMDRLGDEMQHGLAIGNPEVIDREVTRLANEWRDRTNDWNELLGQQATLLADYHGPSYIHRNWREHAGEDDMRLAHDPVYAQDRAEINELVDGLVEVGLDIARREVDLIYGFAQHVVAHNEMCLDLVHDVVQLAVAFNEVRYKNPWIGVGVQEQHVPVVEMNTIVNGLGTQPLYVPTNLRDTPESFMEAIEEQAGYLPPRTLNHESAYLVHDGTVLDNDRTLGDSGVINESSIGIHFRGLGGGKSKLQTQHSFNCAQAKRQKQMQVGEEITSRASFETQSQELAEDTGAADVTQGGSSIKHYQYTDPGVTEFDDEKYDVELLDVDLSGAAATATTSQSCDIEDEFGGEKFDMELSNHVANLEQSTAAQQCDVGDTDEQSTLPVSSSQVERVDQPAPHQPATCQPAKENAASSSTQVAKEQEDGDAIALRRLPHRLHHNDLGVIARLYNYVDDHFRANNPHIAVNIILEVAVSNPKNDLTGEHFFQHAANGHLLARPVGDENEKLPPQEPTKRTLKPNVSSHSKTEVKLSSDSDCVFSDDDQSECTSHRLSDETKEVDQNISRIDIAAGKGVAFNIDVSRGIVSSALKADDPSLIDIKYALENLEMCIKNSDSVDEKLDMEVQKSNLLIKFIPGQLESMPSTDTNGLSKAQKAAQMKELEKWAAPLVSAISLLDSSITNLEQSGKYNDQVESFKQSQSTLVDRCITATKPVTTSIKSSHQLVKFMEDNYVHVNMLRSADKLMNSEKSPHGVVAVLQDKLILLDRALTSDSMDPNYFLNEWNRLEAVEAEAVSQVICTEGIIVEVTDKETGITSTVTVMEPGDHWELNRLTEVQLGRVSIALKNWHPPTKKDQPTNQPDLSNGCLRAVNELDPRIIHIEGGGVMTEEFQQHVKANIAIFDLHDLFPKTKKYWDREFKTFTKLSGLESFSTFQLRGLTRPLAQHVLNKLSCERSHIAIFSAEALNAAFSLPFGVGISKDMTNAGKLAHGEAQCEPKMKMSKQTYSYQDLLNQSARLGIFLSPIDGMCIPFNSGSMAIIARRHDDYHLSPEDEELLRDMKRQWCVMGYNAAVEKVCLDNEKDFHQYCEKKDIDVTSESIDPVELYKIQKSFFSSRGKNAAVLSVYEDNKEEAFIYIKDRFPNQVSKREDITFEHMDSYFGSRGKNAAVLSVYEDNKEEAFIYIKGRFPNQVSTPEDITFEHMSSYLGHYTNDNGAGTIRNHDPRGILQYFDFTGNGIASMFEDYDVPQLRTLALMYKVELQAEVDAGVCDQNTGSMPLDRFTKATERFIAKVDSLTDLPEGWTLPSALEFNQEYDITVRNNMNSYMRLVVTPNNEGTKEMTRHLSQLIIKAMEKFDRPVRIQREGSVITINYPRFSQSCKSRDSGNNPFDANGEPFEDQWSFSLSYLVLSKVLLQDPSDLNAKFYTCPGTNCSFRYNLMDKNEMNEKRKQCLSKKRGGCGKRYQIAQFRPSRGL